jgi:hypothetical protein
VITGGRSGAPVAFAWESLVAPSGKPAPGSLLPEHRSMLRECRGMLSVAELAAHLDQPPPVVQVLLSDLLEWGLITVTPPVPPTDGADAAVLRKVLHGLESRL